VKKTRKGGKRGNRFAGPFPKVEDPTHPDEWGPLGKRRDVEAYGQKLDTQVISRLVFFGQVFDGT
jgi:hypothetical protein